MDAGLIAFADDLLDGDLPMMNMPKVQKSILS